MTYVVGEVNSARVDFWCDFASREHLRNRDVGAGGGGLFVLQSSNLYQMKALDE